MRVKDRIRPLKWYWNMKLHLWTANDARMCTMYDSRYFVCNLDLKFLIKLLIIFASWWIHRIMNIKTILVYIQWEHRVKQNGVATRIEIYTARVVLGREGIYFKRYILRKINILIYQSRYIPCTGEMYEGISK